LSFIDNYFEEISKMSQLFDQLQQHYCSLSAEITAKLSSAQVIASSGASSAGKRKTIQDAVDKLFVDVYDTLDHLELLVRDMNGDVRQKYASQVEHLKTDAKRLDAEAKNILSASYAERSQRDELFDDDSSSRLLSDDKRQQMMSNLERLDGGSRKLEEAYRVTRETENIGAEVLNNLSRQREVITGARGRVRKADEEVSESSRVLSRMLRRALQNRLFLFGVVAVLVIIIIISIYVFATRK